MLMWRTIVFHWEGFHKEREKNEKNEKKNSEISAILFLYMQSGGQILVRHCFLIHEIKPLFKKLRRLHGKTVSQMLIYILLYMFSHYNNRHHVHYIFRLLFSIILFFLRTFLLVTLIVKVRQRTRNAIISTS